MPRSIPVRLALACALALTMSLTIVASAAAKGFSADLRVVGSGGKFLAEKSLSTATTSVKTSPKATCFGAGTGGSGKSVSIQGTTALGLLAKASKSTGSLSPLLISDSFEFGLALCGVGTSIAKNEASWYVKVNHKALSVGADAAKIKAGDEVLFALAKSDPKTFAYPDELALVGPSNVQAGKAFTVRAYTYDEKGKRTPAEGVKVSGASGLTGPDGKAQVTLRKPSRLLATMGELIPDRTPICVAGKCPSGS
jgi:hypothetical protein